MPRGGEAMTDPSYFGQILVFTYPLMKRVTWWPQFFLGLTFNWGALVGFAAQTGRLDLADLMLYAGLFFWTLGYDTIYAHQDKEDDILIGVKSSAIRLGQRSKPWIYVFYTLAILLMLAGGVAAGLGLVFALAMLAPAAHLYWQVRSLDIDRPLLCLKLFKVFLNSLSLKPFAPLNLSMMLIV